MRCLYICSHQTLIDFEVPILFAAGCEVYCVKSLQNIEARHHTVEAKIDRLNYYDAKLTIPKESVELLNQVHWYTNNRVSVEVMNILNTYFDFVVCTLLTEGNFLQQLVREFQGKVCIRYFGREGDLDYEYFMPRFEAAKTKFQFWFSYPEILKHEVERGTSVTQYQSFVIPLGCPEIFFTEYLDTWKPSSSPKVCFVCSKINLQGYYTDIFHSFEAHFCDFINKGQVVLLGKNNNIQRSYCKSNLNNKDFYAEMQMSQVMYYHGKEPRHMHYHPLEAVVIGLPLIFHSESLVSVFLPDSPGKCNTIAEARTKVQRVLDNDTDFINSILTAQAKCRELIHPINLGHIFDQVLGWFVLKTLDD